MTIDEGKLHEFLGRFVGDLGATVQEVGTALGAQAGEARLRHVATAAGYSRFRRAAETPFNHVYEARR